MAKSRKGLKICCGVTALVILILVIVTVVLFFTVFKPRQPKIVTQSVTLVNLKYVPLTHLNVTLAMVMKVHNPNYGSFKYKNATAFVTYRGTLAAVAPVEQDTIPARGDRVISTNVVILGDKLLENPGFWGDIFNGTLEFTSTATFHGKASVIKVLKIKATTFTTCDITVVISPQNITSVCSSKVKF